MQAERDRLSGACEAERVEKERLQELLRTTESSMNATIEQLREQMESEKLLSAQTIKEVSQKANQEI